MTKEAVTWDDLPKEVLPITDIAGLPLTVGDLCYVVRSYQSATIGTVHRFGWSERMGPRVQFKPFRGKLAITMPQRFIKLQPFMDKPLSFDEVNPKVSDRVDFLGTNFKVGHLIVDIFRSGYEGKAQLLRVAEIGPKGGVLVENVNRELAKTYGLPRDHKNWDGTRHYASGYAIVVNDNLRNTLLKRMLAR